MKVLLLSPPYVKGFARDARSDFMLLSGGHWYPIWLSYCGALLEKYSHKVKLIDAPSSCLKPLDASREIIDFYPELIVVYSSTKTLEHDIEFCRIVKDKLKCKNVLVGEYTSSIPDVILKDSPGIDGVIRREFEFPVLKIANGIAWEDIENLVWKVSGSVVKNKERPPLDREELDSLPFVSGFYKRHLNLKHYRQSSEPFPFVDISSGRGCEWGGCSFCIRYPHYFQSGQYNTRSIYSVIEEIKFVKQEMPQVKSICFQDDNMSKERATDLSEAILRNNLDIAWSCFMRADRDYKTLRLMKSAGCRTVHVGYESGEQSILDKAHKGLSIDVMAKFTEDAQKAGLRIYANFVMGLPGETEASIKNTVRWIKKLKPTFAQFTRLNICPSARIYGYLTQNKYIENGTVSYPHLSNYQLCEAIKQGYREFYFSPEYIKEIFLHPAERFFSQIRPICKVLPNILWKKW